MITHSKTLNQIFGKKKQNATPILLSLFFSFLLLLGARTRRYYVSNSTSFSFSASTSSPLCRQSRMPRSMISTRLSRAAKWGSHKTGLTGSFAMLLRIASLSFIGPLWKLQQKSQMRFVCGCAGEWGTFTADRSCWWEDARFTNPQIINGKAIFFLHIKEPFKEKLEHYQKSSAPCIGVERLLQYFFQIFFPKQNLKFWIYTWNFDLDLQTPCLNSKFCV